MYNKKNLTGITYLFLANDFKENDKTIVTKIILKKL